MDTNTNTYTEGYILNLKILELLKNKGVKPDLTKKNKFQINKQKNELEEDTATFIKCSRACNITDFNQLNLMIVLLNDRLRKLPCNIEKLKNDLKALPKKISKNKIAKLNKELAHCFNVKNRVDFIKKYGAIKLSLTFREYETDKAWLRINCGWVDLHRGLMLADNINLNCLYYAGLDYIVTDRFGVYLSKDILKNEIISFDFGRKTSVLRFSKTPLNHVKKLYWPEGKYIIIKNDKQTLTRTTKF